MSALTDIVVIAIVIGVAHELFRSGKIDQVFQQLQSAIPTPAAVPEAAPAPAPEAAPAPAEGGGGGEEAAPAAESTPAPAGGGGGGAGGEPVISGTNATLAGCGCSCMNMDSDKTRWKIETASGTDCYNHIYPGSIQECATALKEVCAGSCCGGGGGGEAAPAAGGDSGGGGGGDDKAADSGGGDKESNYVRKAYRGCLDYTPMNWG